MSLAERLYLLSLVVAWGLALAAAGALIPALVTLGRIQLRVRTGEDALITDEGPEIHSALPVIRLTDESGAPLLPGERAADLVLLLLSWDCAPCDRLLRAVPATIRGLWQAPDVLVVMEGPAAEADRRAPRQRNEYRLVPDPSAHVRNALGISRVPYGLLVDAQGIVRMKGVVNNRSQLESLIRRRGRHIGRLEWEPVPDRHA